MNLAVVGTGYVGLVTGACFASSGNNVICVDIDESKIKSLKKGKVPFFEPGLEKIVENNLKEGRLIFTTQLKEAVKNSRIIFIAVGTPRSKNGAADISAVLDVARSIGEYIEEYKIVVTKSTVPVGTTHKVRDEIKRQTKIDFDVASNPEFLKEGAAVEDFLKPERVVIGVEKEPVGEALRELYSPFMRSGDRAIIISIKSSELSKYASNAMLATRISFMNEIANLCEIVGANVDEIRHVMGTDKRIGKHYLYPGLGYGGSCFPKDVKALIYTGDSEEYDLKVCKSVDHTNDLQREVFFKKIYNYFHGDLKNKRIGTWGLSFKPNTDDIREAPSIFIINKLLENSAVVTVHDPCANGNVREIFGDKLFYVDSSYDVCTDADALVINTEWNEYRQPDFDKMLRLMKSPIIFDGRNLYNPSKLNNLGFKYFGVGI